MNRPPRAGLLGVLLALALTVPTFNAYLYFVALAGGGQHNPLQQAMYTGGKVIQVALAVVFVLAWRRPSWPRSWAAGVPVGVAFGLVVAAAMVGVYHGYVRHTSLLAGAPAKIVQKMQEMAVDTPARYLALAVALSGLHSLFEEGYWRWFVFGGLRELLPRRVAIPLAAVGFAAHHVVILAVYLPNKILLGVLPLSAGIAIGGAFWCWLYDRTGSLLGPWLGHLLIDAAIFVIGYDLVFVRS